MTRALFHAATSNGYFEVAQPLLEYGGEMDIRTFKLFNILLISHLEYPYLHNVMDQLPQHDANLPLRKFF